MDRPVIEPDDAVVIAPSKRVLEPVLIIPLWKVFSRMCAAAFRPSDCGVKADARLCEHVIKFERFSEIRVEDHRPVADTKIATHQRDDAVERPQTLVQQLTIAEDRAVTLHGPLHGE